MAEQEQQNNIGGFFDQVVKSKFTTLIILLFIAYTAGQMLFDTIQSNQATSKQSIENLVSRIDKERQKHDLCREEITAILMQRIEEGEADKEIIISALDRSSDAQKDLAKSLKELKEALK
jgi:hypothetical protein